jgi:hypothetical protein
VRKQRTQARDPIFALIADHNAKLAAQKKISAARARREQELDAKADYQARAEKRLLSIWDPPLYLGHAYPVHGRKDIKRHVLSELHRTASSFGPKAKRRLLSLAPLIRKEIEQMLDAFRADHKRQRREAGLEKLHDEWLEALDAWGKSRRRMVSTAPRTPQGAAALADVLARFEFLDGHLELGVNALARAVAMAARKSGEARHVR